MEGHTQGHLKRNREDVLFRIPKTSYFRTRYREISMTVAHSSEIETKKNLILKEKRLDLLGRVENRTFGLMECYSFPMPCIISLQCNYGGSDYSDCWRSASHCEDIKSHFLTYGR